MINIGTLLDACGISYTEKQLKKLDRLFNHLVKGQIFKDFPGIDSKDNSTKDSSSNSKSLKVYFIETKEKESSENVNEYFESENNVAIKEEENLEECALEIKDEFDPFAALEAVENSKGISDSKYANYYQNTGNEKQNYNCEDFTEDNSILVGSDLKIEPRVESYADESELQGIS